MAESAKDRPAKEIEITPEMIEAGKRVIFDFDPEWSKASEAVAEIYTAMAGAIRR